MPDAFERGSFFITRASDKCDARLAHGFNAEGVKGCKERMREIHKSANLCQLARSTDKNYPNDDFLIAEHGLDFCSFKQMAAIGPKYIKPQESSDFVFRSEVYPKTGVQRDDTYMQKVFADSPEGWGYIVEETLENWFYQNIDEYNSESPDLGPADVVKDWETYMEHEGKQCRDTLYNEHQEHIIDLFNGKQDELEWEDCGEMCSGHCESSCECHWGYDAKKALENEGQSSIYTWNHNDSLQWECVRR